MLVKGISVEQQAQEYMTANLELYLTKPEDKKIITEIINGKLSEISMSAYVKPKESWDSESKFINDTLTMDKLLKVRDKIPTNPCKEILLRDYASGHKVDSHRYFYDYFEPWIKTDQFRNEYKAEFMDNNTTPHTSRVDETAARTADIRVNGQGLTGQYKVTDETATLRVEMPGVEPETVEIKRIDNMLRIRVQSAEEGEYDYGFNGTKPPRQLYLILADKEEVTDTELELGVLTVNVNRNREVEEFSV